MSVENFMPVDPIVYNEIFLCGTKWWPNIAIPKKSIYFIYLSEFVFKQYERDYDKIDITNIYLS